MNHDSGGSWHPDWVDAYKPNPIQDVIYFRDKNLADAMSDCHPPGCVEMDGEYMCSPVCRVGKE